MTDQEYILSHWKKKTVKQMAEESGIPEQKIRNFLSHNDITPTSEKDLATAFILDHYETMTPKQIAAELKVTVQYVSVICKEWGIKCFKPGKKENPVPKKSFWDMEDRWEGVRIRK